MTEEDVFAQQELKRVRDQARQNAASYILQRIEQATQGRPETVQGNRAPVKYARKPKATPVEGLPVNAIAMLLAAQHAPAGAILDRMPVDASGDLLPTLITPEAIRQRIAAVDAQVDLLDKDISRLKDKVFVERWAEWWGRWKAWKDKVSGDYWLLVWSGKAVDEELTQWQKNLEGWRGEAKKRGEIVSPAPPGPPPSTQPTPIGEAFSGLTTAVTVVAIAGLGIVAIRAFKG